jgi:hypothetical protein
MELRRIYVIAGNYREFVHWCQDNHLKRHDPVVRYVSDFSKLRGFHIEESKGDKVVLYGTFESRMDWPLMAEELKVVWRP